MGKITVSSVSAPKSFTKTRDFPLTGRQGFNLHRKKLCSPNPESYSGTGKQETVKDAFVRRIRDTMGMQGTDPVFNERGPGLVRVVIALEKLLQLFPDDV